MTVRCVRFRGVLFAGLVALFVALPAAVQAAPPNIVFFLVDDLGSADCGFAGGTEIKTPRIDALAAAGTILDAFYVQHVCSPTRACLMTGRYPTHTGVYTIVRPHSPWGLPLSERTLADALKAAGYQTAITGKWHLGEYQPAYVPTARGFDRQYGHYFGAIDHFEHVRDGQRDWYRDDKPLAEEGYATDLIAAEACRIIKDRDAAKPLFLYVPFNAVHAPLQAPPATTEPYAALDRNLRILAGMLASVDAAVGRIVDALAHAGIRENTLIVFHGDNGGPKPGSNGSLRGYKGSLYEGGIRTSAFVNWPGHVPAGRRVAEPLHTVDWFPTLVTLASGSVPADRPLDGRDAWPAITAGAKSPHETILVATDPDRAALRMGDWKLIKGGRNTAELYNLASDPGERRDLAAAEPGKRQTLEATLAESLAAAVPTGAKQPPDAAPRKRRRRREAAAARARPAKADERQPNVLWIYLEDVSGWFSCSGEKLIETPHIDSLAARGTRFTRFYTSAGVCSATRSAVMLGAMQTTFGAHHHRSSRNNAAGTKHDGIGMIHLPEGVVPLPQWCRQHGVYTFNEGRRKDDFNFVFSRDDFYDHCPDDKGWGPARTVSGECWQGRGPDQPFFGQVQLAGGKYGLGRNASPPQRVVDRAAVPVPPYYPDIPEVREEIGYHYDCLVKTDEQVGEVLAALERDGLVDSTVVVLFSDHGHGLHRHKQFLYDGGINMPLIVAGPGIPRGRVRDDLASSIDVAPTTLGILGLPIPRHMEGRDLFAAGHQPREFVVAARDRCDYTIERIRAIVTTRYKYLRNYLTDRPYMQPSYKDPWPVSIRLREMMARGEMNEVQRIFFGDTKPAEELYDLESDPHEIRNLVGDPAHASELARHRRLLADWIAATGDKAQAPEDDGGLIQVLYEWGEKCVNPEYERLRGQIEPREQVRRARQAVTPLLRDDFSQASLPQRRAIRGDWKYAANVAGCTQDDDLYAKFKNHGPIIFYDLPFTDARVRFAFRGEGTKNVVFTANGADGHVARVQWTPKGSLARAFPPGAAEKSLVVAQNDAPLPAGTWVPVEVVLAGPRMTVKAGDGPAITGEHPTFASPKTNLSIGFSFGTLQVKDVIVEPVAGPR